MKKLKVLITSVLLCGFVLAGFSQGQIGNYNGTIITPIANSSTIISGLGYTPVNKAGDTMTGALTTPRIVSKATGGPDILGDSAFGVSGTSAYGVGIYQTWGIGWTTGLVGSSPLDLALYRDAANVLGQRNGTNAQTLSVYNTYTDPTNYERLSLQFDANIAKIRTLAAGSGTARPLQFVGANNAAFTLHSSGILLDAGGDTRWTLNNSGHLVAYADNVYDIGASGSAPRTVYAGTSIQYGRTKVCTSATTNSLLYISVPNTNMIGGKILYTVNATDGTDSQQITGTLQFGAVGKATAVTANITDIQNTSVTSAGTLTALWNSNVVTNNVWALHLTPTTSLTTTNLTVKWRLETPSTYTVNAL